MSLSSEQAEVEEWSGRRGEFLSRRWTRTEGDREFVDGSLVIQIRRQASESATLVASTANGKEFDPQLHALIETTGTDLAPSSGPVVIAFQIQGDQMARIPNGDHQIEFKVLEVVGGEPKPTVILPYRHWRCRPRVAVRGAS